MYIGKHILHFTCIENRIINKRAWSLECLMSNIACIVILIYNNMMINSLMTVIDGWFVQQVPLIWLWLFLAPWFLPFSSYSMYFFLSSYPDEAH